MADKVTLPGVIGLTNYRSRLNRPVYGTITRGTRTGTPNTRRNFNRYRRYMYRPQAINPVHDPLGYRIQQYLPSYGYEAIPKKSRKQYKSPCCRYIKGKRICKPKFCPKKYYPKKFYWY